jgi:1,4-alpha-glucan branching enzyme
MYAQPGKKLLFMGDEFGQVREWTHDGSLEWHVLQYPNHAGVQKWVEDLNQVYRREPALHEVDSDPAGFEWIDCNDSDQSTLTFMRKGQSGHEVVAVACNFTPVPRVDYRVGVPRGGFWREILNSDAPQYWGGGWGNLGGVEARHIPSHGRPYSLSLTLPALAVIFLKSEEREG